LIGNYKQCSFNIEGTGTFFGNEASNPAVGEKGKLEKVKEIRLEMVCAKSKLAEIAQTIKKFHPYETPGWEVYALVPAVSNTTGQGRIVKFDSKVALVNVISKVKELFGLKYIRVATPENSKAYESIFVQSVALCAGSGASVLRGVQAHVYLTGEMGHHEILDATANGTTVILCEHTNTERGYDPLVIA